MAVKFIFRIYSFHYRNNLWDRKTTEKWEAMLSDMAKEYRRKAEKLGGVLVKVGQFLSTRTDIMPDIFIEELNRLVDRVPPMPYKDAKQILEAEWGGEIEDHLEDLGKAPIASASIGDVYHGRLKDGLEVAIKIKRKRIDDVFHKDFFAMRIVFWILRVFTGIEKKTDLRALYRELATVMKRELDYVQELEFSNYFRDRYSKEKFIHIPAHHQLLCTERVLVMEWVEGSKITDLDYLRKYEIDIDKLTKRLFNHYMDQFLNPGKFHADPHVGNIIVQKDGTISIIDFGMIGEIKKEDTEQFKLLVQGFIIDNYDMVVDALDGMNFILPAADKDKLKKVIKEAVELYSDGSLKNIDSKVMDRILDDLHILVKEQPVQMPADYAYLLRAVSIIFGIVFAINPEVDIKKWVTSEIKKWFGARDLAGSVIRQYGKNVTDPLLSYPKALLDFLQSGERDREWDKEKHHLQLKHHFFLMLEAFSFLMFLVGILTLLWGMSINYNSVLTAGAVLSVLFLVVLNLLFARHNGMIKKRKRSVRE